MKTRNFGVAVVFGFLFVSCSLAPGHLMAQASPGPLNVPPSKLPPSHPTTQPKPKEIAARTSLDGIWKFNLEESDDPGEKARETTRGIGNGGRYPRGGNPGGGYPGGGYPGGGYPGGGYPGGGYPGGGPNGPNDPNGPYGGGGGRNVQNNEKLQELIRPASSLTFAIKTNEIDVTDEHFKKLVFCIDGRQIQKPKDNKDNSDQEIAARWDGRQLVSDEKGLQGGKMSRTFELSGDGKQFYETWRIDRGKSTSPLVVRYVYDVADPRGADRRYDPEEPVLKRKGDTGNSTSSAPAAPAGQASDPDQPVLKRQDSGSNSGDSDVSPPQSPQPSQAPDPDKPVLRRRTN